MKVLSGAVYEYVNAAIATIPGNYLEIGVFNGTGFAQVAKNNLNKQCYAIDPFIEDGHTIASSGVETHLPLSQQKQNFLTNTQNLSNVTLFETSSTTFLENLTTQQCKDMNVTMVVIDGNHHYPHVVNDFMLSSKLLLNQYGQIIVDDTNVSGVSRALNEFKEQFANCIIQEIDVASTTKVLILKI